MPGSPQDSLSNKSPTHVCPSARAPWRKQSSLDRHSPWRQRACGNKALSPEAQTQVLVLALFHGQVHSFHRYPFGRKRSFSGKSEMV